MPRDTPPLTTCSASLESPPSEEISVLQEDCLLNGVALVSSSERTFSRRVVLAVWGPESATSLHPGGSHSPLCLSENDLSPQDAFSEQPGHAHPPSLAPEP